MFDNFNSSFSGFNNIQNFDSLCFKVDEFRQKIKPENEIKPEDKKKEDRFSALPENSFLPNPFQNFGDSADLS